MRSDTRALVKVFAASAVLALVLLAVLTAAALDVVPVNAAVGAALVLFLVGAVVIGQVFARGLLGRPPVRPNPDRDDYSPD